MDKVTDINTERSTRNIFDIACYHALFDLTQEVNAVVNCVSDLYKNPNLFVDSMVKHLEPEQLGVLSYVLKVHGENMVKMSNAINQRGVPAASAERVEEEAKEYRERPQEPIIHQYLDSYCDLIMQSFPDK